MAAIHQIYGLNNIKFKNSTLEKREMKFFPTSGRFFQKIKFFLKDFFIKKRIFSELFYESKNHFMNFFLFYVVYKLRSVHLPVPYFSSSYIENVER